MRPQPRAYAHDSRNDVLWLVPLALVVVVGSRFTNMPDENVGAADYESWLAAALAAVAALGLFVSLQWPLRGAVMTFVAVTSFVLLDLADGPVYLTLAAVGFLVAVRVTVRTWVWTVTTGALAVCAALVLRTVADYDNQRSLWQVLGVVAVITAGAAVGTLVRTRAAAVIERARTVATQEQLHMAQELHDGVGHGLAVIAMQAGVGLHVLDRDPAAARTALEAIRDSARESLDALRAELAQFSGAQFSGAQLSGAQLSGAQLSGAQLSGAQLSGALPGEPAPRRPRQGVADLDALVDRVRTAGLNVELTGSPGELAAPVDAVVYGVVQEGLTNVLRHAAATSVAVRLDRSPGRVTVTVEDDGRGAGHGDEKDVGMGLRGMRDRVQALGGEVTAGPRPTGGFAVRAVLPL